MCNGSLTSGVGGPSSGSSMDVSDTQWLSSALDNSEFSTDVSDTCRVKYSGVGEGRDNQDSLKACVQQSECCHGQW